MGYVMTGDLTYKINYDDKTAFVVEANNIGREVIIPDEVDGCKVISIMKEAFKDNLDVVIVTIPTTVEFIGAKAFMNCINLKTVIIKNTENFENNVTLNMYSAVFANCTNLTNVDLRYPTKFMDWSIFENCVNLENISTDCILGNVPSRTFDGCVKLRSFCAAGIETIEEKAFRNVILARFDEFGEIQEFSEDFMQALKLAKISCPQNSNLAPLAYSGYDVSCY